MKFQSTLVKLLWQHIGAWKGLKKTDMERGEKANALLLCTGSSPAVIVASGVGMTYG